MIATKNNFKRLSALALAVTMAAALAVPTQAASKNSLQNKVNNAQQNYENQKDELQDLKNEQAATQQEINGLQSQTAAVQNQLNEVYDQLVAAQGQYSQAMADAAVAQQHLEETQQEYADNLAACKAQLAAMQQLHDGGGIAMLSQCTNLYELLTFSETLEEMSAKNSETLAELDQQAQDIAAQKQAFEEAAALAKAAEEALTEQQAQLDTAKNQLAAALMEANQTLSEQQAATAAQEAVTEQAKKAYDQAMAELEAYNRSQANNFGVALLHCSKDFGAPLYSYKYLTTRFGNKDAIYGKPHRGCDIAANGGTPIHAVADGVVTVAKWNNSYGYYVQIGHGKDDKGNSYDTLYAHMTNYCVAAGQSVKKGDVIGYVGNTGDSRGNHLHLELWINNILTNPLSYIPMS